MTRVTAPIGKLTRFVASAPSVARPAYIRNASQSAAAASQAVRSELTREDTTFTAARRPQPRKTTTTATTSSPRSFHTTAPRPARGDQSTIDYFVLPGFYEIKDPDADRPIRVPILPDNYSPDRTQFNNRDKFDAPATPPPEILVVAANPENVTPASALAEVEHVAVDGVELKFAHSDGSDIKPSGDRSQGMLKDLWKGLVDDVLGAEKKKTAA